MAHRLALRIGNDTRRMALDRPPRRPAVRIGPREAAAIALAEWLMLGVHR